MQGRLQHEECFVSTIAIGGQTQPILPFNFKATAQEFIEVLSDYEKQAKGHLEFARPIALAKELEARIDILMSTVEQINANEKTLDTINMCLLNLSRALVPIGYTVHGPFGQDIAGSLPPIPGLKDATTIGKLPDGSDDSYLLRTALIREITRVTFGLRNAIKLIDGTLVEMRML